MKVGTKSLLFGCHQFILHPLFTFAGWIKCYGWDSRGYSWWKLIVCFIIHDWGYLGSPNMDGEEGERHPKWAFYCWCKFGDVRTAFLCLFHSRFLAKKMNGNISDLCWADKMGTALMPPWLWVFLGVLTGELWEYMGAIKHRESLAVSGFNPFVYFQKYREVVSELIEQNTKAQLVAWSVDGKYVDRDSHPDRVFK